MNKPRIDPNKLNQYGKLLDELWETIQKLTKMHKEMSIQERVLAGATLIQSHNPWADRKLSALIGDKENVAVLVNQAVNELQRPVAPPQPIFKKEDDPTIN